jgi:putative transposase
MPRPPRFIFAGEYYHVLNRANRKEPVFHSPADFGSFIKLVARAQEHIEIPILAACLMPNHVHFVVRSKKDGDITLWVKWLLGTHAIRYNKKYRKTGHVWQGRFKAVPVQSDHHLLGLMRYVERNAARANIVKHAEHWRWGSLRWRTLGPPMLALTAPPIQLPIGWAEFVNTPQTAAELEAIRTSVNRQRPFGDESWVERRVQDGSLEQTIRQVGRPRKSRR